MQYVFNTDPASVIRYQFPTHANDLVLDRSNAAASEVFMVVLKPGQAPPLHKHDDTEQIFFIVQGSGRLEIQGEPEPFDLMPGQVVRITPGTWHRVHCTGPHTLRYLCVDCFPGGRPTDEPTWESHVRVMCDQHGWSFDDVIQNSPNR